MYNHLCIYTKKYYDEIFERQERHLRSHLSTILVGNLLQYQQVTGRKRNIINFGRYGELTGRQSSERFPRDTWVNKFVMFLCDSCTLINPLLSSDWTPIGWISVHSRQLPLTSARDESRGMPNEHFGQQHPTVVGAFHSFLVARRGSGDEKEK